MAQQQYSAPAIVDVKQPGAVNPFGGGGRDNDGFLNAVANTDQHRAIAEIQGAVMMAKQFPRDPQRAVDRILNACTRPTLAEQAVYSYPRGGQEVSGPSIRLAEAVAQEWGNISFGIQELDQRDGESSVMAFAWDLETNTRRAVTFQVPHIRHTKKGATRLTDPRDVYEMVANQGARRLRACILGVIPGDVIEAATKQCELTLATNADTSKEAITKMVKAFEEFGVTRDMLKKKLGVNLDAMRPAQMAQLRKIYGGLRDGMGVPGDYFDTAPMAEPAQKKTQGQQAKPAKTEAMQEAGASQTEVRDPVPAHDPETGEVVEDDAPAMPPGSNNDTPQGGLTFGD